MTIPYLRKSTQATQERPAESAGASPARGGLQTPPKLTEANGEEVPKATLEEVARIAASNGKLRFCVMALLSARNFRVRRKLGQDVISLFNKGRHDKVPHLTLATLSLYCIFCPQWQVVFCQVDAFPACAVELYSNLNFMLV